MFLGLEINKRFVYWASIDDSFKEQLLVAENKKSETMCEEILITVQMVQTFVDEIALVLWIYVRKPLWIRPVSCLFSRHALSAALSQSNTFKYNYKNDKKGKKRAIQ